MSLPVDRLRDSLRHIGRAALTHLRAGDSLRIRHERDLLVQWLGGEVAPGEADGDRIAAAILAFRDSRFLNGTRQARLVCYGCVQAVGDGHYRLIEDRPLFEELLVFLARHRHRTRLFRKCYRGLLGAYFAYDPDSKTATADGRANHEALRQFLDDHRDYLESSGLTPAWVGALAEHSRLLAADPCQPYGFAALRGDWARLDDIRERLDIGSDSWLMRKLVLAQVDAVTGFDDDTFGKYIESILLLLDSHPLHADVALGTLLDRLARCAGEVLCPALGEQAVTLWGNPWLANSANHWQCGHVAREMVSSWLKRHLLQGFFANFVEDSTDSRRRAGFWDIYCDDLVGMYFALGKAAFAHHDSHSFKFRRDARGLVVRLADTAPGLHVLILQFGQHHVVELSKAGQVAYFYETKRGTPPFYLSKGWIDIGALSVSKLVEGRSLAPYSKPLRHLDSGQFTWEGKFARELGATENAVRNFCRIYQCGSEKSEHPVGQWLRPWQGGKLGREAESILQGWGYAWLSREQGYFRARSAAHPV